MLSPVITGAMLSPVITGDHKVHLLLNPATLCLLSSGCQIWRPYFFC
jgi:hypothetical protein